MRKLRARRVEVIEHISDGKLQAIVKALDLMTNNHKYVIVPEVVDKMVVTSNIRLKGKREKITFSSTEGSYLKEGP
jgi:hypothetical protein